jgi:hypothetical protein
MKKRIASLVLLFVLTSGMQVHAVQSGEYRGFNMIERMLSERLHGQSSGISLYT